MVIKTMGEVIMTDLPSDSYTLIEIVIYAIVMIVVHIFI